MIFIKNIIRGFKNLYIWIPIIWMDRNYDYRYLINIQLKKMEEMYKWFSNSNNTHISDKDRLHICSRLKTAIKLTKLVYDEHYLLEYQDKIEKLYGKSKIVFKEYDKNNKLYEMDVEFENKYYNIWMKFLL